MKAYSTKVNNNKAPGAVDRDGSMCKYKWTALLQDYKKIYDFYKDTRRDERDYWLVSLEEKKEQRLPRIFL